MAKRNTSIGGGVIDSDYRGEISVIFLNHNSTEFQIKKGDKIAQMLIEKITFPIICEVEKLDNTSRGECGFGSSDENIYEWLELLYNNGLPYNKRKCVTFDSYVREIFEPPNMSYDLNNARKSNWKQRILDKIRFQTLLNPILSLEHRKKVYKKIFGSEL